MKVGQRVPLSTGTKRVLTAAAVAVFLLFAAILASPAPASAAQTVPYKVNFQGRLTDSSGTAMADGSYNMRFKLYSVETGGTAVWTETRETGSRVVVTNGLFSVQLGDVSALSPSVFTAQPLYFEIELPTTATATCSTASCASFNGTEVMTPRRPLGSSPYAINSDTLDGIDGATFARQDQANTFTSTQTFESSLGLKNGLNTLTLSPGTMGASYAMTLPTAGASGAKCLASTSGSTASATALEFTSCGTGGSSSLQGAYDGSGATPEILLHSTNGGINIRDNSSAVSGNLFSIQNNLATATYLGMTSSALTLQNGSGRGIFELNMSSGHLKIYEDVASNPRYADIYFDTANNEAVFAASSGNTRIGNGSGNFTIQLSGQPDVFSYTKNSTLGSAYSGDDFLVRRSITAGANSLTGSVLRVESNSGGSGTVSSNVLWLNAAGSDATSGNLILATTGGSTNRFVVDKTGNVTIGTSASFSGGTYTGQGAVTVGSGAASNLTLQAAGSAANRIVLDATNNRITLGTSDDIGTTLVLDTKTGTTDPDGTNGAMYYNSGLGKFRCYESGSWKDCIAGATSKFIAKGTLESVNNSVTLQSDDELSFTMGPNEVWVFNFVLLVANNSNAGPDWKSAILAPNSASCNVTLSGSEPAGAAFPQISTTNCTTNTGLANATILADVDAFNVSMQGRVTAGASGGTVTLQWAHNTATASNLDVRPGSYVIAQKVGGN